MFDGSWGIGIAIRPQRSAGQTDGGRSLSAPLAAAPADSAAHAGRNLPSRFARPGHLAYVTYLMSGLRGTMLAGNPFRRAGPGWSARRANPGEGGPT